MPSDKQFIPVRAQPGRPLYETVMQTICAAIDAGRFVPGEQIPTTKHLSEQLHVSLVTAHRALQELVHSGVLDRAQGRGTFVHHRYFERRGAAATLRMGLVFHSEASLADYYHGQILDGVHQAAASAGVDLILLRLGDDVRNECDGYLFVNPFPEDIEKISAQLPKEQPAIVVGAESCCPRLASFNVDNVEIARLAVRHFADLGHHCIGYVGAAFKISNSRDRWDGFNKACIESDVEPCHMHVIRGRGWRLDPRELVSLADVLRGNDRPSAIFAAGYSFALDVLALAAIVGLRVPQDLSVISVDDPSSAAHLSPPLSTIRQPLVEVGRQAVAALAEHIKSGESGSPAPRRFKPELVLRESTAAPAPDTLPAAAD